MKRFLLGGLVVLTGCASASPPDELTNIATSSASTTTSVAAPTVVATSEPVASSQLPTPSSTEQSSQVPSTTDDPVPTTSTSPESTAAPLPTRVVAPGLEPDELLQMVIRFESRVGDVSTEEFAGAAMAILNDDRGWRRGGFEFIEGDDTALLVVLGEGPEIDTLCLPLQTRATVSCQNGATVGLNADRWRTATDSWDGTVEEYRTYVVNHELGHLIGMRHPTPRCPTLGAPAAVMEPQTGGLAGCIGNGWPRDWEIGHALVRPAVIGPLPDWAPDPVPPNLERVDG